MDKNWTKKQNLSVNILAEIRSSESRETETETGMEEKDVDKMSVKEAENQIQNLIILRAWRQQREKNVLLETDVKTLRSQVENLQLQTYTLKQLLEAEETRVVQTNNDLKKVLNALEECKFEKKTLVNEKEQLETRLSAMEEQILTMESECRNKKNELVTARLEAHNWEKQLDKEREKLTRLKDEKKFLLDEVRFKGNLLVWQIRSFEQFSRLYNILQGKPSNPALPWDDTFGRNSPVSEMSKPVRIPKRQPTIIIVEKPPGNPELINAVLARVEKKPGDEDGRTEELERSISEKTNREPEFEVL